MTDTPVFNEGELMHRVRARDQHALGELYDRYSSFIYGIALRVLNNDLKLAEEVTQDTFLKVWNQAEMWDPQRGRLATWLLTIARRTAIDRLRKEHRQPTMTDSALEDLSEVLGERSVVDDPAWQDGRLLRGLLRELPVEQVQAIELAFFAGMSHTQIAEHLSLPLGTVKTRIQLGLQKLRGLWLKAGGSE